MPIAAGTSLRDFAARRPTAIARIDAYAERKKVWPALDRIVRIAA
jgi:hypothetical protein